MYTDGLIERRGDDIADRITRISEHLAAWAPGSPPAPAAFAVSD